MHLRRTSKKALAFAVGTAAAIFVCVCFIILRVYDVINVTARVVPWVLFVGTL
jgi:hypothetical protein